MNIKHQIQKWNNALFPPFSISSGSRLVDPTANPASQQPLCAATLSQPPPPLVVPPLLQPSDSVTTPLSPVAHSQRAPLTSCNIIGLFALCSTSCNIIVWIGFLNPLCREYYEVLLDRTCWNNIRFLRRLDRSSWWTSTNYAAWSVINILKPWKFMTLIIFYRSRHMVIDFQGAVVFWAK